MIVVRDLHSIKEISNAAIRGLVQRRIHDLGGDAFNTEALGTFLVIEPGDQIQNINREVGFNILHNRLNGLRFDQSGFTPSFEFVEEYPCCYDMVFVLSDDGIGVELFVSKDNDIDADLIAMCCMFAFQSQDQDAP